jgi:protein-S-isoprenylcysteine O-methyltransferase Ste14
MLVRRPDRAIMLQRVACRAQKESESLSKAFIIGWIIECTGMALWLYGYFVTGHPSLIDWHASTPWWIADYLPNIESEIGMALLFAGMVPLYWPPRR